ncbi:MAG: fibronectin type III domain-containing protein, partial [Actinomycetes bacterium]
KTEGPVPYTPGVGATLTNLKFQPGSTAALTIGSEAFRNAALTSLTIPDRVTTISSQVFYDNTLLNTVRIGSGVTSIGADAFNKDMNNAGAILNTVIFRGNKPFFGDLTSGAVGNPFNHTGTTPWYYWNGATGWAPDSIVGHPMSAIDALTVSSISPTSGQAAGGTPVTITGTNFVTGATATIGGVACTSPTVVDPTALTCTTGAGTAGSGLEVTVTNPIPEVATQSGFTYFGGLAPAIGATAVSGANTLNVNWANPSDTVTGFTVDGSIDTGSTWSPVAGGTCSALSSSGPVTTCTATGLTPDTAYVFRVTATYPSDPPATSAVSAPVVTATSPDAPTIGATTRTGNLQLTAAWTNSASHNSPVTSMTVQYRDITAGGTMADVSTGTCAALTTNPTSCTVTGLTDGHSYDFQVRATNAAGSSVYSSASTPITALAAPGAPTITAVAESCSSLAVSFTAPTPNGSSAVITYQYSTDGGTTWATRTTGTTASPLVITKVSNNGSTAISNGTAYSVQIRASNSTPGPATPSVVATPRSSAQPAGVSTYVVPAGVSTVFVVATGAGGGTGGNSNGGAGGNGAKVTTYQPVTAGHVLTIKLGGGGCAATSSTSVNG